MTPAVGGSPEASATPIHSGSATRKTTTDAKASRPNVALRPVPASAELIIWYFPLIRARVRAAGAPSMRIVLSSYDLPQKPVLTGTRPKNK